MNPEEETTKSYHYDLKLLKCALLGSYVVNISTALRIEVP